MGGGPIFCDLEKDMVACQPQTVPVPRGQRASTSIRSSHALQRFDLSPNPECCPSSAPGNGAWARTDNSARRSIGAGARDRRFPSA